MVYMTKSSFSGALAAIEEEGVLSAAVPFGGIVVQGLVFSPIAEKYRLESGAVLWVVMIVVGIVGLSFGVHPSIGFIKDFERYNKTRE